MTDPAPVEVRNTDPIAVVVDRPTPTDADTEAKVVAASSRVDASILRTEDQRRISGIWERTQQVIALSVVETALGAILLIVWRGDENVPLALTVLFGLVNLVIGFYFGRTNHTRVGGSGATEDQTR